MDPLSEFKIHPVSDEDMIAASVFLIEARDVKQFGPEYFERAFEHWHRTFRRWFLSRKKMLP
jgi:hypothetical protein